MRNTAEVNRWRYSSALSRRLFLEHFCYLCRTREIAQTGLRQRIREACPNSVESTSTHVLYFGAIYLIACLTGASILHMLFAWVQDVEPTCSLGDEYEHKGTPAEVVSPKLSRILPKNLSFPLPLRG
ncbi:hypothetical protein AVEN_245551-1 [Araneus ventricosus]|uniref:Uncharacterized protein n=1 Tax=Araneus ventricosus TaxID=182803 RepID=A0A4Y1ZWI1_ARAVE|nr:hypothetical protein AVEN_245551-1 [Araneus ventricosus]